MEPVLPGLAGAAGRWDSGRGWGLHGFRIRGTGPATNPISQIAYRCQIFTALLGLFAELDLCAIRQR